MVPVGTLQNITDFLCFLIVPYSDSYHIKVSHIILFKYFSYISHIILFRYFSYNVCLHRPVTMNDREVAQ